MIPRPQHRTRALARASQFRRILGIHHLLLRRASVTAESLGKRFEVSPRTCKRDIELLRDTFQAPLEWDARERTYRYTQPFDFGAQAQLSGEEALSLALASKTFAAWGDTQLARALEAALGKMTDYLSDHASFPLSDLESLISEPSLQQPKEDGLQHFQALLEAIRQRKVVVLNYRKPSAPKPERRRIHPLHLALQERRWIVVAYDPVQQAIRKFVLYRIQSMEATDDAFEPPADFDARAYLRGSFGHFAGETEQSVVVRILPELAPYIIERRWHPSQTNEPQPDGSLIVRFTLTSLEDIRRWVLGWGCSAEALEPPELREAVKSEIEKARRLYG